jgi:nicotinate-nucleotide pyrophosphorylase (carboxylating)
MTWVEEYLREDVGDGDITTLALIGGEVGAARIRANENGVVAGLEQAMEVFRHLGLKVTPLARDGEAVSAGANILSVEGPLRSILTGERLALNFLMRMSGIATATSEVVNACRERNPEIIVAATRKTTPGFRHFEKRAVVLGGGDPHRNRLDDAILIKDNHLAVVGSITEAVRRTRKASFTKKVEVEVENQDEAEEAAKAGADVILLDNMAPREAGRCAEAIRRIDRRIVVEASGGIAPENAPDFAEAVDVISLGWLTHSARAMQYSLDVLEIRG